MARPECPRHLGDGFFLIIFLTDAIIMVVPADTLLAITLLLVPQKKREWFLAGFVGAILGYVALAILTQTTFQPVLVDFIRAHDFTNTFQDMMGQAHRYGYVNLIIGCLTIVPQNVCLVGGILIGLNPLLVFVVVAVIKWVRILVVILLVKQAVVTGLFLKEKMHLKDYWMLIKSFFHKASPTAKVKKSQEKMP